MELRKPIEEEISPELIREQLARILVSGGFEQSERLCRFLRYTIDASLEGNASGLKESLIGIEVYDRPSSYDPAQDSIVRTEARRLRNKLADYYETEGKSDPVEISFPLGGYAPAFRRLSREEPASESRPTPHAPRISIAALPFSVISGGATAENFSRDLHEELVHALMHTDGVRVAAGTFLGSGDVYDIVAQAQKMGVHFLFEGTIREQNEELRVNWRLVNADGFQIWSERFPVRVHPQQSLEAAEQTASAMISRVRPEQSAIRRRHAEVRPPVVAVYSAMVRAERLLDEGGLVGAFAARDQCEELIEKLPDFARTYCVSAAAHCELALSGLAGSVEHLARARVALEKAQELDPEMIAMQAGMGRLLALEGRSEAAEESFRRALQLGEHAGANRQLALLRLAQGRFDEAWRHLSRAQKLDPFSPRQKIACARYFRLTGQAEEARAHFARQIDPSPLSLEARVELAFLAGSANQPEAALMLAHEARRQAPDDAPLLANVAELLALTGRRAEAEKIVQEHRLLAEDSPVSHFRRALLELAFDHLKEAREQWAQAQASRDAELIWRDVEPRLAPLRYLSSR